MYRRARLALAVMAAPLFSVGAVSSPALANGNSAPHYSGPAPGELSCSVSATISFSPPLGKPGSADRPAKVKGALKDCQTPQYIGVNITGGTLTGSFSTTPYACAFGCGGTDAPAVLSVAWKGDYFGSDNQYGGTAHFTKSTVTDTGSSAFTSAAEAIGFYVPGLDNSSAVTGSFASNGSYLNLLTAITPAQFASGETGKKGLKKLVVTGTLTLRDITAYVTNAGSNTVTPIDTSTNATGPVIAVGSDPGGVAITPDGATAYVANNKAGTVTPIDTFTNTPGPVIDVGMQPQGIAVTPNGATAYVANAGSNTVTPITTSDNTPGPVIDVGSEPSDIAITPNGATAYVTNAGNNTVTPITTSDNAPGPVIDVGSEPSAIAITPDGATAYVANLANGEDGNVTPITTSDNTPGAAITINPGGGGPIAVTPDGATAYVGISDSNYVTPIDTATNTSTTAISIGEFDPVGIAITPEGATAYVTNGGGDAVIPINTSTNTTGPAIDIGSSASGIAIG